MTRLLAPLLYLALGASANGAAAQDADVLEALKADDMRKLVVHEVPVEVSDAPLLDAEGTETTLADYRGRIVLLNFWATWCAPCRHEMPSLDALERGLGGDDFIVLPVATGRNSVEGITRFFDEVGVTELPILMDRRQAMARDMAVLGLPITVILDREGREVARLRGDADWNGDSARAIIQAMIDG